MVLFVSLGILLAAALVCAWVWLKPTPAPTLDTTGLEGTWRDRPDSRHTYQFRANGNVDAWYESLPMGGFMTWTRNGQEITIHTTRGWDFAGQLSNGEIRGKMMTRDQTGATIQSVDQVWRRE
jgi:hypothetical protein